MELKKDGSCLGVCKVGVELENEGDEGPRHLDLSDALDVNFICNIGSADSVECSLGEVFERALLLPAGSLTYRKRRFGLFYQKLGEL